jgi:hypothetical protein
MVAERETVVHKINSQCLAGQRKRRPTTRKVGPDAAEPKCPDLPCGFRLDQRCRASVGSLRRVPADGYRPTKTGAPRTGHRCPATGISARRCAPGLGGLSSVANDQAAECHRSRPAVVLDGAVSVIPAATAGSIGCSRRLMFRNWANSAGTVAKRAALTVNGRTCVSRDNRTAAQRPRHGRPSVLSYSSWPERICDLRSAR